MTLAVIIGQPMKSVTQQFFLYLDQGLDFLILLFYLSFTFYPSLQKIS
jgi:hypothetical protein